MAYYKMFGAHNIQRVNVMDLLNDIKRGLPVTQVELDSINRYLKQRYELKNKPKKDTNGVTVFPLPFVPMVVKNIKPVQQVKPVTQAATQKGDN